jgi:hypothetical protein
MKINSELYDGIETVEFQVTDRNKNQYFFPDIPKLRNKLIRRIEIGFMAYSPSGYLIPSIIGNFYLNMFSKNIEKITNYPVKYLEPAVLYPPKTELFSQSFDLSKSYFFISDTSVFIAMPPGQYQGFTATIYYQDPVKSKFTTDLPAFKIDYVEAQVSSITQTVFNITNYRNIQNKRILGISVFNPEGTVCYTPDGRQIVSTFVLADGAYLTLWDTREEIIKDMPIYRFSTNYPLHSFIFFRGLKIDWAKSTVKMGLIDDLVLGHVFYLPVFYID